MRLATREGQRFGEIQAFRWFRLRKRIRQFLRYRAGTPKTVLLVVGCQRSGTSMIHHLFRRDRDAVTYDEISPLSAGDEVEGLRWTDPAAARARILADRAPFVVTKPLVESQQLAGLLDLFEEARAIWMLREVGAVAASNLAFFGEENGHRDLAPILAGDESDWRAEGLPAEVRAAVVAAYRPDLSPLDAAALFWYARNSLFFSQGLETDARVALCRYEDLTARPVEVMGAAYAFLGRPFPGKRITVEVQPARRPATDGGRLDPVVAALCQGLWERFSAVDCL